MLETSSIPCRSTNASTRAIRDRTEFTFHVAMRIRSA